MAICVIPGCRKSIKPGSLLKECSSCRAYLVRYYKVSPARVMERRQNMHLYDSRLQVIMPGEPDDLTEKAKLVAPANYRPQSSKGRAAVKRSPQRRAHAKRSEHRASA